MKDLPDKFLENMQKLLADEYEEFLSCYEKPFEKGLRFNSRKVRPETIEKLVAEWKLEKVPWTSYGYYYRDPLRPGLSPYHDAGVYYMQEPSAMSVAEKAGIRDTDIVLDLCAAPGGKSTRAAELCSVLLSNEINASRAKILSSNIERMGFENVIVSSADSAELADAFPGFFDVILCDAPCSGEGMMRRDEIAVTEWSEENVQNCVERQKEILENACRMLRPGGKLVYSTCTFEKRENEDRILELLSSHPELELLFMERFWPHKERGEGHFVSAVKRTGEGDVSFSRNQDPGKTLDQIERRLSGAHLHILRKGLVKGERSTDKKGTVLYTPSHAEIMASSYETCKNGVNIKDPALCAKYLSGDVLRFSDEEAEIKGEEGFVGVYFDGYPLGLGKRKENTVKNHLPKGLRRPV